MVIHFNTSYNNILNVFRFNFILQICVHTMFKLVPLFKYKVCLISPRKEYNNKYNYETQLQIQIGYILIICGHL